MPGESPNRPSARLPENALEAIGVRPAALIGDFYAERNREYPLGARIFTAGRSPDNYLRIPDERVADRHIRISRRAERFVLEVLSAERPTFLNDRRLDAGDRRPLRNGDRIRLSTLPFSFSSRGTASPVGRLFVTRGVHRGKVFRLRGDRVRVGRAVENDVQFPDGFVSRRHCLLTYRPDGWWIQDLDSTNGTWIGRAAVNGQRRLETGDQVRVGCSSFRIAEGPGPGSPDGPRAAASRMDGHEVPVETPGPPVDPRNDPADQASRRVGDRP